MKIVAVVPTRKGSQRVKNKNIRKFADTSLIELKLKVLRKVKGIDEIIVNTDCEKTIELAKKMGLKYHKRDAYYASSNVTNDEHWRHLAEVTDCDVLMIAQTTSPLVKVSTYETAIKEFLNSKNDSLNSVSLEKKFLWLDGKPINYDISKTPKSQDLPDIVSLNFAITIIKRDTLLETKNVVGKNPKFITLDKIESVDIDDEVDFMVAECLYQKLGIEFLGVEEDE